MKTTPYTMISLEAEEGYYLYNGDSWGRKIFLGKTDNISNWQEVPKSFIEELEKKLQEEAEQINSEAESAPVESLDPILIENVEGKDVETIAD